MRYNLTEIKSIASGAGLTFMVKADAYNHGAVEVARSTEEIVDTFGVADASEGAALRVAGIKKRILVTVFTPQDAEAVFEYGLTPFVSTRRALDALIAIGKPLEIDLKIDTGMGRLGFRTEQEIEAAARKIKGSSLSVRGIGTHFYMADSIKRQTEEFYKLYAPIKILNPNAKVHLSATSGILQGVYADEVRAGLLGYGYGKSGFKKAMTVTSEIISIKKYRVGEIAGYGAKFIARRESRLALISGGYADGISRDFSGKRGVLIGKQYAPFVGRVSMDTSFIDITDVKAQVGNRVTVFGGALHENDLDSVYEIMTGFKCRVERGFVNG